MGYFALLRLFLSGIPEKLHRSKLAHIAILTAILWLNVDATNDNYINVSQRITLKMDIVTPMELDAMESLCILNLNPIKGILYDKDTICTPEVKEFFYERMDYKSH